MLIVVGLADISQATHAITSNVVSAKEEIKFRAKVTEPLRFDLGNFAQQMLRAGTATQKFLRN